MSITPLEQLETICAEIYGRWDKDMRSGKLLQALAGTLPKYRADVDAVRSALVREDGLRKAVHKFLEGRMAHFTDSRFVDDDLVELAAVVDGVPLPSTPAR